MNKPFFSIVIPSYNSANYLEATLASLACQSFKDFEVVVVDDGSTDSSLAVSRDMMAKYELQGRVMARPSERIKGVASCRNYGVELAQADWICFLDSDDLFLPEKLAKTHSGIINYGADCKAYHHGARNFDDATGATLLMVLRGLSEEPTDMLDMMVAYNYVITSTATVSKDLFIELGGFNTALHGVEDYMMWLLVSKASKWSYINEPLTEYRVRPVSLMGGREMKHYVQQNNALLKVAKQSGVFTSAHVASIEKYFFNDLMHYYAMESLKNKGWGDLHSGLSALAFTGRYTLAFSMLCRFYKRQILATLVKLKN